MFREFLGEILKRSAEERDGLLARSQAAINRDQFVRDYRSFHQRDSIKEPIVG